MDKPEIFVADDNKAFLALMQELLLDEGYEVTVLQAGDCAYRQITQAAPDLVILDLGLEKPDDGWHLFQALRSDCSTMCVPVVICSGAVMLLRERREEIERLGCVVVEKPFDLETLLSTVRGALAGSRQLSKV